MNEKTWPHKITAVFRQKVNSNRETINSDKLKTWFSELIVTIVNHTMTPEDQDEIIVWFRQVQQVLEDEGKSSKEKFRDIYSRVESTKIAGLLFNSLHETLKSFKDSELPTAIKISLPIALGGLAVLGSEAMGLAAFGSAIGLPVALVLFIGATGVALIVESLIKSNRKGEIARLLKLILRNEILRRKDKLLQEALKKNLSTPKRQDLDSRQEVLKKELQNMNPFDFERHVMSFFPGDVGVTPGSNDFGIDGWCYYEKRLILVQCKRYQDDTKVGRPEIQAFKGAVGDKKGEMGLIVTTGTFTKGAVESARLDNHILLIDINTLLEWHTNGFDEGLLRHKQNSQ